MDDKKIFVDTFVDNRCIVLMLMKETYKWLGLGIAVGSDVVKDDLSYIEKLLGIYYIPNSHNMAYLDSLHSIVFIMREGAKTPLSVLISYYNIEYIYKDFIRSFKQFFYDDLSGALSTMQDIIRLFKMITIAKVQII